MSRLDDMIPRKIGPRELEYFMPYKSFEIAKEEWISLGDKIKVNIFEVWDKFVINFKNNAPSKDLDKYSDDNYLWLCIGGLFDDLINYITPEGCLYFIDNENICTINTYNTLIMAFWSRCLPFFSLPELACYTDQYIGNWQRNKEHLIITGQTKTVFSKSIWMCDLFKFLYPVFVPFFIHDDRVEDVFGDSVYGYEWSCGLGVKKSKALDYLPTIYHDTNQMDSNGLNAIYYDYETGDGYATGLSYEGELLLDRKRAILYELFLSTFVKLRNSLSSTESSDVLLGFNRKLKESIDLKELKVLLDYDACVGGSSNIFEEHYCNPAARGLSCIIDLIGHYEKECKLKTMDKTRELIDDFVLTDRYELPVLQFNKYIEVLLLKANDKIKVENSLDAYVRLEEKEKDYWKEYHDRATELICRNYQDGLVEFDAFKPFTDKLKDYYYDQRLTSKPVSYRELILLEEEDDIEKSAMRKELQPIEKQEKIEDEVMRLNGSGGSTVQRPLENTNIKMPEIDSESAINIGEKDNKAENCVENGKMAVEKEIHWNEYAVIVCDLSLYVKKNGKWRKCSVDESGFGNSTKKNNFPNRLWPLLQYFGEIANRDEFEEKDNSCYGIKIRRYINKKAGEIRYDDPNIESIIDFSKGKDRDHKLSKRMSDLRKPLETLFEIQEKPIGNKQNRRPTKNGRYYLKCDILRAHWSDITIALDNDEEGIEYDIGGIFKSSVSFKGLGLTKKNDSKNQLCKKFIELLKQGGRVKIDSYVQ